MKTVITTFFFILFIHFIQAQPSFQRSYGGVRTDGYVHVENAYSLIKTMDGGFLMNGLSYSFAKNNRCYAYVIKTDSSGNLIWSKNIGGNDIDVGLSILENNDSTIIIAGYTKSFGAGKYDVFLSKLSAKGDVVWYRVYGGTNDDLGFTVEHAHDGGYIIAGNSLSFKNQYKDMYVIKTDTAGVMQWSRIYGGSAEDFFYGDGTKLIRTSDKGYAMIGETNSFGSVGSLYLLKIDSTGKLLWSKVYNDYNQTGGYELKETPDNGFILSGYVGGPFGAEDIYIVKTDSAGNVKWSKIYGEFNVDNIYSVSLTNDGGYAFTGGTQSFGNIGNILLMKTDSIGKTMWSFMNGHNGFDYGSSVVTDKNNHYYVAGRYEVLYSNKISAEASLQKFTSDGNGCEVTAISFRDTITNTFTANVATTVDTPLTISKLVTANQLSVNPVVRDICIYLSIEELGGKKLSLSCFPNPANDYINVVLNATVSSASQLEIYTVHGQLADTQQLNPLNGEPFLLNINHLPKGLYIVKLTTAAGPVISKFVKQ